jgi:glucoamylase
MHFSSSSFVGLVSLLLSQAIAAPSGLHARDVDSFVAAERPIALQGALNNIGPNGSRVAGAGPFVVASPSKVNPDCKYLHLIKHQLQISSGADFKQIFIHGVETQHSP